MRYMAETKANKWEVLSFIEDREVIMPYELADRFNYTYPYACKKLSHLKRQGLISNLRETPLNYRGQWYLTDKGYARLRYLCRKLGVATAREQREWREWLEGEIQKPREQQRYWFLDERGMRLIRKGERGVTFSEAMEAEKLNRLLRTR